MFDSNVVTDFVRDWGYIAVFIGSLFEGEVILITASALAALGYLDLTKVFFVSLCTTVFADQFLFFLGYKLGTDWLIKRLPKLEPARAKVFKLLHTMDIFFIFAFRFVYGIRTISPLIIGSAKIQPRRFVIFNMLSGLCWASAGCFIGYVGADVIMDGKFDSMPAMLALSILLAIVAAVIYLARKMKE